MTLRTSLIPALGEYWPEHAGHFAGLVRVGTETRALIVPSDPATDLDLRAWGSYGVLVPGADHLNDGQANTRAMAAAGNELALEIQANFPDLYIPSRGESRILFVNCPDLFEKDWYLTSTQNDAHSAYAQDFGNGTQTGFSKSSKARVRLVRSFPLFQ